eukprot:gene19507-23369_t
MSTLSSSSTTSSNEVQFFKSKNCVGTPYLSCVVGENCWVNCYQHNDAFNPETGVHQELKCGTHNDLSSLKGLSKFQVLSNIFGYAIDVKLVDKVSPVDTKCAYEFTIIPYCVQPVKTFSGNDYVQCPIPKLTPPNAEIVCQIVCKQVAWPGTVVSNGSIYFQYEPSTGILK